jgi:hypothetical protein
MGSALITACLPFSVGGTRSSGWLVGLKSHRNLGACFCFSNLAFVVWAVACSGLTA